MPVGVIKIPMHPADSTVRGCGVWDGSMSAREPGRNDRSPLLCAAAILGAKSGPKVVYDRSARGERMRR